MLIAPKLPLFPPRTPALHRGDGARGTFRPWRSGPDQALQRLRPPSHESACVEQHEASLVLLATYLPESLLIHVYTPDGRLLNSGVRVILSA